MSRAFVNVLGVAICLAYSGSFVIVKSECHLMSCLWIGGVIIGVPIAANNAAANDKEQC